MKETKSCTLGRGRTSTPLLSDWGSHMSVYTQQSHKIQIPPKHQCSSQKSKIVKNGVRRLFLFFWAENHCTNLEHYSKYYRFLIPTLQGAERRGNKAECP